MSKDLSNRKQTQSIIIDNRFNRFTLNLRTISLNLEYDGSSNLMVPASSSDYKKVLQNRRKTDVSFNRNKIKEEQASAIESMASTDASALEDTLSRLLFEINKLVLLNSS